MGVCRDGVGAHGDSVGPHEDEVGMTLGHMGTM